MFNCFVTQGIAREFHDTFAHPWVVSAGALTLSSALSFLGTGNWILFVLVLGMQTLEMAVEWGSKRGRHKEGFDPKKNVIGKLMVLSLVVVAWVLDRVFVELSAGQISGEYMEWFWVTKSTLVWIILGEAVSITRHIEDSEGKGVIPIPLLVAITWLRTKDRSRWEQSEETQGELPKRREYDRIAEDPDVEAEAVVVVKPIKKRKAGEDGTG